MPIICRFNNKHAEMQWRLNVLSKPKLRTYKLFKTNLHPEKYCTSYTSRAKRSVFAQFRCGVLPLNIEVGRFRGLAETDRLCIFCNNNSIESEVHFLLECPFYSTIRTSLLNDTGIDRHTPNKENINVLMNSHQRSTLNHLFDMWLKRRNSILQ